MISSILCKFREYYSIFGLYGFYYAVVSAFLKRPKAVRVTVKGIAQPVWVRLKTSDIGTFKHIFLQLEYKFDIAKSPNVIIDAGANVGYASIYFANRYPKARIYAIEPSGENYEMLKTNVGKYSNIIPIRAALWKENTTLTLTGQRRNYNAFRICESLKCNHNTINENVKGVTVDGIMQEYGLGYVELLKVDIEGAEKEVFKDPSSWIDRVGFIVIELHDRLNKGCSDIFYHSVQEFERVGTIGENIIVARNGYFLAGS